MNSREQFEADCIAEGRPFLDRCTEPGYEHQYANPIYQARWEAWQASREALVVKLPDPIEVQDTGDFMCCVIDELDQAGVRYE